MNKLKRNLKPYKNLKGAERLIYLCGIPIIFSFGAYQIYNKNVYEQEERVKRIKKAEKKLIDPNPDNMVKL